MVVVVLVFARATHIHKHTGPSYKPYCMPSLTVALLLLEWLHDGVYAGRCARTLTHLLVQAGEQCVQYKGKC